jgi:hypothetical protein
VAALGCGPALFSVTSYRGHRALEGDPIDTLEQLVSDGEVHKAEVLRTLGPPVSVLGQEDGEIFVYRHVARDTSTINLNPGYIMLGPSIPLWVDHNVSGRDDLLMLSFDAHGALRGASLRQRVAETGESRAAVLGEGMRRWLE